ncbi:MAG TPA: S8 family serine peptidase [Bradyrhizobium sp.]|nr:S8 family serine peptidase [Bradyrhizobium sp.]
MQRILVKAAPGLSETKLTFGATAVPFEVEPLFKSIGTQSAFGAAADDIWYILKPREAVDEKNPWDLCHRLMQQGFGVVGAAPPKFAEPDIEQKWITGSSAEAGQSLVQSCDVRDPQNPGFPVNTDNYWFRDATHSQFDAALAAIGGPDVASKVRIAHFDTGYDPHHHSLPKRLRRDIARNFVDDGNPNDASDHTTGLLTNLGHGTGTLSILAGTAIPPATALGGAPFAEVVPVRVANRVVLFSNSAIAKAFDYVHELNVAGTRVDIITMSMGGLASQAWADAVNALYEQGVFIVTAAGNNFGNLPTHNVVYPARFNRVVAACGVMANGKPYADLALNQMAGNYGPIDKMSTAIAAPTPNVPWARLGCPDMVDYDGSGTSAATPQVAAAAAIWLQKNRAAVDAYPEGWMRIEAVRKALFESTGLDHVDLHLGRGKLHANDALTKAPSSASALRKAAVDTVSLPILQVLGGLGIAADDARQRMLQLEALQLSQSTDIENLIPPDLANAPQADQLRLVYAIAAHPTASNALREALNNAAASVPFGAQKQPTPPIPFGNAVLNHQLEHAKNPTPPKPAVRPLRVYAYDPSLGARLDTASINEATLEVRWEDDLEPGPIGEYIEVMDVDPASECCYAPVDLNHPYILTRSGLTPSEASPQFHQQMVYAVSMKTIEHFEKALGRVALWAPREIELPPETKPQPPSAAQPAKTEDAVTEPKKVHKYVQRLRIYPHALRAKNAYYSPEHKALLLGYFKTTDSPAEGLIQGSVVFTAVSHDVVAHETTHALLDGVHRRFREATNPDVFAFHEAFADIVALFQHFTLQEALRQQIAATRGDLEEQNLLGQLAVQFGEATDRYGALRDYIGKMQMPKEGSDDPPKWVRAVPKQSDYEEAQKTGDPHMVGAVLVAAVFDAFLQIYKRRTEDLRRIATGGTGVLPQGAISADLVNRLAREASKVASQMLNICIRALDYCPPIDIIFGEYLRALITADTDLVPYDRLGYRVAFIEAFRNRGIYPRDVKHLSPGSLRWEAPPLPLQQAKVREVLKKMSTDWDLKSRREDAYDLSNQNAKTFWHWLMDPAYVSDEELAALGLLRIQEPQPYRIGTHDGELRRIEVHSVRPVRRVSPDGNILSDLVVEITQSFRPKGMPGERFRGGCTLIIDLATAEVRYMVRKKVDSPWRFDKQFGFAAAANDLGANYFTDQTATREPFAMIHHVHG